jgi:hypothetical protein
VLLLLLLLLLLLPVLPALRNAGRTAVLLLAKAATLTSNVRQWLLFCTVACLVCGASLGNMAHHMWHTDSHGLRSATATLALVPMHLTLSTEV